MKAIEFVKKHGWDAAKHKADELKIIESMGNKLSIEDNNLIRLVESHELVERMGGTLNDIKEHVRVVEINLSRGVYFKCTIERNTNRINRIKQAIADVESCL